MADRFVEVIVASEKDKVVHGHGSRDLVEFDREAANAGCNHCGILRIRIEAERWRGLRTLG